MSRMRGLVSVCTLTALLGCEQPPVEEADDVDTPIEPADDDDVEIEETPPSEPDGRLPLVDGGRFPRPRDGGVGFPAIDADFPSRPTPPVPARLSSLIVSDRPPPPISGGSLTVTDDGAIAVAADSDRDAIYMVSLNDRSVTTVTLPAGSEPGRTVLDGSGHAHVVLRGTGKVARLELGGSEVVQSSAVCQLPRGIAYDASQDAILVACAGGELVTLAAKTHAELARVMVERDLRDVVIAKSGTRFVSRYRSAELLQLGADGKVVGRSRGAVSISAQPTQKTTMEPTLAWRTVTTPDGQPFMLHQKSQKEEVQVAPGGYGGACQTITQPGVTQYDESGRAVLTGMFGGTSLTVDVAIAPAGDIAALAVPAGYLNGQTGTLRLVPLTGLEPVNAGSDKALPILDAPTSPKPLLPTDPGVRPPGFGGGCAPTTSEARDAQVTSVAFDGSGLLYAFSREPAQLLVYTVPVGGFGVIQLRDTLPLGQTSVRDTGHELFHADVGSGLACASCHGEALDDGHVWTFAGFGPRRTQNMRGGLLQTLPLHWEGDMPTFQHLVDEVMTGRMSGFKVEPLFADALAAWIDKQPALALQSKDAELAAQGKALFESAAVGCATCHSGRALTNNQSADVGTGGPFQVPSLLGLALRAPYMHDGCATTLEARFDPTCGGGDKHGKTSQLTQAQIAQLVAYLESL